MNESATAPIASAVISLLGDTFASGGIGLAIVDRARSRRRSLATGVLVDNVYGPSPALAGQYEAGDPQKASGFMCAVGAGLL
jgi:hypothetical protein